MMIVLKTDITPSVEQVTSLYLKAELNRPTDDRRMRLLLNHANIKISAWDGESLVGFLRGLTDYCFDCYINDLAVDPDYQGQGIGKRLIEKLKGEIEEDVLIFLISAPQSIPFYQKLEFKNFKKVEDTWYLLNKRQ